MIKIALPPNVPINKFTNNTQVCPLSSDLNKKLNIYVKETIAGPYSKYKKTKYFL